MMVFIVLSVELLIEVLMFYGCIRRRVGCRHHVMVMTMIIKRLMDVSVWDITCLCQPRPCVGS